MSILKTLCVALATLSLLLVNTSVQAAPNPQSIVDKFESSSERLANSFASKLVSQAVKAGRQLEKLESRDATDEQLRTAFDKYMVSFENATRAFVAKIDKNGAAAIKKLTSIQATADRKGDETLSADALDAIDTVNSDLDILHEGLDEALAFIDDVRNDVESGVDFGELLDSLLEQLQGEFEDFEDEE